MKGSWAVLVTAAALVGCRSSQPTPNPFMRTTVAPPATGQAVVVPGEPYYPGAAPQGVPPVTASPPAAVPLGPPPAGPPVVAPPPPPVIPQRDKYSPPGGSYQYHQSSNDRSEGDEVQDGASRAAKTLLAHGPSAASIEEAAPDQLKLSGTSDAVEQAMRLNREDDPVVAATYYETELADARDAAAADSRGEPPQLQQSRASPRSLSAAAVNIVGPSAADPEDAAASTDALASGDEPGGNDDEAAGSQSAIAAADAQAETASEPAPRTASESPAVAAVERTGGAAIGGGADYAFAPDYSSLSGRLEYSQSARQWKLRYIPIDGATDSFGGSVVLGGSPRLQAFKPGDRVAVHGALAAKSSTTASFSPLYQLDRIEPLVH